MGAANRPSQRARRILRQTVQSKETRLDVTVVAEEGWTIVFDLIQGDLAPAGLTHRRLECMAEQTRHAEDDDKVARQPPVRSHISDDWPDGSAMFARSGQAFFFTSAFSNSSVIRTWSPASPNSSASLCSCIEAARSRDMPCLRFRQRHLATQQSYHLLVG